MVVENAFWRGAREPVGMRDGEVMWIKRRFRKGLNPLQSDMLKKLLKCKLGEEGNLPSLSLSLSLSPSLSLSLSFSFSVPLSQSLSLSLSSPESLESLLQSISISLFISLLLSLCAITPLPTRFTPFPHLAFPP